MRAEQVIAFTIAGLAFVLPVSSNFRKWFIFICSIIAIYWLQPPLSIRWLDYSLPTATLAITVLCWSITRQGQVSPPGMVFQREDWITLVSLLALVLILTSSRYINLPFEITTLPPDAIQVAIVLSVGAVIAFIVFRIFRERIYWIQWGGLISIISILVVIKMAPLAQIQSRYLRYQAGQDVTLASAVDIRWLGFSYVAFRLIHTLRDAMSGILPPLTLREYTSYVVFFPAYTAGPIDRIEHFLNDYRDLNALSTDAANRFVIALMRLAIGLFKKLVIADSLSIIGLNVASASQANSTPALWIMLYAYTFRVYFDFSGYSDVAIGMGLMLGIRLPENFSAPYLKTNIAAFWQGWHATLSNWARFYVYTPLSRSLLRQQKKLSNSVIIFICTLATMIVIGLWHGISIPFLVWGLWHGLGLFAHKLWSDRTRVRYRQLGDRPKAKRLWDLVGWFLTFHFVALGWVWFVMPDLDLALRTFLKLLGI